MENINEIKEEIAADIQMLIDDHLDELKICLAETLDPEDICAKLERTEESLALIKEKAEELADLWATKLEMDSIKEED